MKRIKNDGDREEMQNWLYSTGRYLTDELDELSDEDLEYKFEYQLQYELKEEQP